MAPCLCLKRSRHRAAIDDLTDEPDELLTVGTSSKGQRRGMRGLTPLQEQSSVTSRTKSLDKRMTGLQIGFWRNLGRDNKQLVPVTEEEGGEGN